MCCVVLCFQICYLHYDEHETADRNVAIADGDYYDDYDDGGGIIVEQK